MERALAEQIKRLMDLCGAGVVLIATGPALLAIAAAVRITTGSPVLFRQERPGLHENPFKILKFRTMRDAVGPDGKPLPDAERLTRLGAFLRSTSLDELPELINVLRGEMSLVGPRPLLMDYLRLYDEEQRRRHTVRPGITGWQAVNGRNAVAWKEKFQLDNWYIDNWSLALDVKILLATAVTVLRRDGIHHANEVTMPPFRGNEPEEKQP